jgi:hypothetical protein
MMMGPHNNQGGSSSQGESSSQGGSSSPETNRAPRTRRTPYLYRYLLVEEPVYLTEEDAIKYQHNFTIDPITKKYIIADPTNIANRGFADAITKTPYKEQQPYMTNFAAALEHHAKGRGDFPEFDEERFQVQDAMY